MSQLSAIVQIVERNRQRNMVTLDRIIALMDVCFSFYTYCVISFGYIFIFRKCLSYVNLITIVLIGI